MRRHNLFLVGFMGTGKTTLSKQLSHVLPTYKLVDIDEQIVQQTGKTIPDIFSTDGESVFRDYESQALKDCCQKDSQIISTGGGIILRNENTDLMRQNGIVCWLTASPETIYDRIRYETHRPLINTGHSKEEVVLKITTMIDSRFDYYNSAADFIVNTDQRKTEALAKDIAHEFERLLKCLP